MRWICKGFFRRYCDGPIVSHYYDFRRVRGSTSSGDWRNRGSYFKKGGFRGYFRFRSGFTATPPKLLKAYRVWYTKVGYTGLVSVPRGTIRLASYTRASSRNTRR